jgi:hypothetical protein
MPLAQLFLVCYAIFALTTPILVVYLMVEHTKLRPQIEKLFESLEAQAKEHENASANACPLAAKKPNRPHPANRRNPRPFVRWWRLQRPTSLRFVRRPRTQRNEEREAEGMFLAVRAGYSPYGAIQLSILPSSTANM